MVEVVGVVEVAIAMFGLSHCVHDSLSRGSNGRCDCVVLCPMRRKSKMLSDELGRLPYTAGYKQVQ